MNSARWSALCVRLAALVMFVLAARVTPAQFFTVSMEGVPITAGRGLLAGPYAVVFDPPQHGGRTIQIVAESPGCVGVCLSPFDSATSQVSTFLPNGTGRLEFYVQGIGATGCTSTVRAFISGLGGLPTQATVAAPTLVVSGVSSPANVLSAPDSFQVRVGVPNSTATGLLETQPQRVPAGPAMQIAVECVAPGVAELSTSGQLGTVVLTAIPSGSSETPLNSSDSGLVIEPRAVGQTQIRASAPGFVPVTGGSVPFVVQPGSTSLGFQQSNRRVGVGLSHGPFTVNLSGSWHQGLTVRVESLDPSRVLVAAGPDDPGVPFIDLVYPAFRAQREFYVQGASVGGTSLRISSAGMTETIAPFDAAEPRMRFSSSPSVWRWDRDLLQAYVGVPHSAHGLHSAQKVAPGRVLAVDVRSLQPELMLLGSENGPSHSVTKLIEPGRDDLSVEMLPLSPGEVMITAVVEGGSIVAQGQVTVIDQLIRPNFSSAIIGRGLQHHVQFQLGGRFHGGKTVRFTSSDPSKLLVSSAPAVVGAASTEVFVPDGTDFVLVTAQALENASGTAVVSASVDGSSPIGVTVTIVPTGLVLTSIPNYLDPFSANDTIEYVLGPQSGGGPTSNPQSVRAGSSIAVTLASTNPSVGLLRGEGDAVPVLVHQAASGMLSWEARNRFEFDPITVGTTRITAVAAGVTIPYPNGVAINVSSPRLSLSYGFASGPAAGFESGPFRVSLPNPMPTDAVVLLRSSNPQWVLLNEFRQDFGAAEIALTIPAGETVREFFVQATECASTMTSVITAECPGLIGASASVFVATPQIDFLGMDGELPLSEAPESIGVRANFPGVEFDLRHPPAQRVRAGDGFRIDVSSVGASAQLELGGVPGTAFSLVIPPGLYQLDSSETLLRVRPVAVGPADIVARGACDDAARSQRVQAVCPGDADFSGIVGLSDLAVIVNNWQALVVPGSRGDLSRNGRVGLEDLSKVILHWQTNCSAE